MMREATWVREAFVVLGVADIPSVDQIRSQLAEMQRDPSAPVVIHRGGYCALCLAGHVHSVCGPILRYVRSDNGPVAATTRHTPAWLPLAAGERITVVEG